MRELGGSASSGSAALVVAALVTAATVAWWWSRSRGSVQRATVRRVMTARVEDTGWPDGPSPDEDGGSAPAAGTRPAATQTSLWRWGRRRASNPTARGPTSDEVAGGMVLIAVALQSGCGVVEAIEAAAAVASDAAGHELAVVAAALRWGVAEDRAWGAVSSGWRRTSVALRLASASGVAPSSLLLSGADDLRAARLASVEVAAARLGVRLVAPLGLAFLPAFVLTTVVPVVVAVAGQVLAA